MTLEAMAIVSLLVAVGVPLAFLVVRGWIRRIDAERLRFQQMDWVAQHKRKITHRGFKSRAGIR